MCCDIERAGSVAAKDLLPWLLRIRVERESKFRTVGLELLSKEIPQVVPSRQQLWSLGEPRACVPKAEEQAD